MLDSLAWDNVREHVPTHNGGENGMNLGYTAEELLQMGRDVGDTVARSVYDDALRACFLADPSVQDSLLAYDPRITAIVQYCVAVREGYDAVASLRVAAIAAYDALSASPEAAIITHARGWVGTDVPGVQVRLLLAALYQAMPETDAFAVLGVAAAHGWVCALTDVQAALAVYDAAMAMRDRRA